MSSSSVYYARRGTVKFPQNENDILLLWRKFGIRIAAVTLRIEYIHTYIHTYIDSQMQFCTFVSVASRTIYQVRCRLRAFSFVTKIRIEHPTFAKQASRQSISVHFCWPRKFCAWQGFSFLDWNKHVPSRPGNKFSGTRPNGNLTNIRVSVLKIWMSYTEAFHTLTCVHTYK